MADDGQFDAPSVDIASRYGTLKAPDWTDDLIVTALKLHGEWAESETELLSSLMDRDELFWDVGAFLGTFSLSLAGHIDLKRVVAVEANPAVQPFLRSNLEQNLKCDLSVEIGGVAASNGWIVPGKCDVSCNHGAMAWEQSVIPAPGSVPASTLKDLREAYGNYSTLKLDVEGMELDALHGDAAYLRERKPLIWAECNESLASIKLLGMFWWLGYRVRYLAFPVFRKNNFLGSNNLIYPDAYEAALVALPPDHLIGNFTTRDEIIDREILTTFDLRRALFDTPRWSQPDWSGRSRAELIALLGRELTGQSLATFLDDTASE